MIANFHSNSEIYEKAWEVLVQSLNSENEHIRVLVSLSLRCDGAGFRCTTKLRPAQAC